jgi:hypothetical protein
MLTNFGNNRGTEDGHVGGWIFLKTNMGWRWIHFSKLNNKKNLFYFFNRPMHYLCNRNVLL